MNQSWKTSTITNQSSLAVLSYEWPRFIIKHLNKLKQLSKEYLHYKSAAPHFGPQKCGHSQQMELFVSEADDISDKDLRDFHCRSLSTPLLLIAAIHSSSPWAPNSLHLPSLPAPWQPFFSKAGGAPNWRILRSQQFLCRISGHITKSVPTEYPATASRLPRAALQFRSCELETCTVEAPSEWGEPHELWIWSPNSLWS